MPIYEYQCQCGQEFEELVFKDDAVVTCPHCGSDETQKLMSCCRFKTGGGGDYGDYSAPPAPAASSSGCAGCPGGSCATCK